MRDFSCPLCRYEKGAGYMVKNALWQSAGLSLVGDTHCIDCFERLLGRPLNIEDFKMGAPINDGIFFGFSKSGAVGSAVYAEHLRIRGNTP